MSDPPASKSQMATGVILLVLLLYIVSPGPISYLASKFNSSDETYDLLRFFYYPHVVAAEKIEAYVVYIDWWEGLAD